MMNEVLTTRTEFNQTESRKNVKQVSEMFTHMDQRITKAEDSTKRQFTRMDRKIEHVDDQLTALDGEVEDVSSMA